MAIVLALPRLYDAVVARFATEGTNVPNLFGWRAPDLKDPGGNRIDWVPGDPQGAVASGLAGARQSGTGNPRSLGTLQELFYIVIRGFDTSDPENERKQYQATRVLFDAWWRAVFLAAHGTVRIVSSGWLVDKKVRRAGAAMRVVCNVDAALLDKALAVAPADTRAEIDVEQLDLTEPMTVPEDP